MSPGKELARMELRLPMSGGFGNVLRVYTISLREGGTTLYRAHNARMPPPPRWRAIRGWDSIEHAKHEYLRRGYTEITA
jgi:hypothetical protein